VARTFQKSQSKALGAPSRFRRLFWFRRFAWAVGRRGPLGVGAAPEHGPFVG